MTKDSSGLTRRTAIKGLAGGLATASVAGLGLLATSGPAAAANFDVGDPVAITSDDGHVNYVAVYGDSEVHWDGFDTDAYAFDISIRAIVRDRGTDDNVTGWVNLHSTDVVDLSNGDWGNYDESLSGPGTSGTISSGIGLDDNGDHDADIDWHIVTPDGNPSGYGLPSNPIDASELKVGGNGENDNMRAFDIVMESTYTWYDDVSEGAEIFNETFTNTIPVDVTNEGMEASATDGDGEDGAVGGPTPTETPE